MTLQELLSYRDEIIRVIARHGGTNVHVFGSVARGDADSHSDIDLLMEMNENSSLLDYIGCIQDLESLLGCRVDLAEPKSLHPAIRDQVLQEAIPL